MTAAALAVDLVRPRYLSLPDYEVTVGAEVAAVATLAGFPPDPEQRLLLDAAFAIDPVSRKSVAFEVAVIAPRQNLKTGFMKQYALGQFFVRRERLVVWSAHEFGTAQEALRDVEALIDGSEWLSRRVKRTNRGDVAKHGAIPEIELKKRPGESDPPRMIFKTRTAGGGRGLSGRKVLLDEGFAVQPGQVGALMPIMLAQPDPQVVIGSSACRPESAVLWELVQRGRASASEQAAGHTGEQRLVYAEWCTAPPEEACDLGGACDHSRGTPGCGCDKPELIVQAHSAVTRGRILLETVVDLRRSLPAEEFGREVMGWHDRVEEGQAAIPYGMWSGAENLQSTVTGTVVLALEVAEDRSWASLAAAGLGTQTPIHGEVFEYKPGTSWVVPRLAEVASRNPYSVLIARKTSAAGALIPELEKAGIKLLAATTEQFQQACGMTFDAIRDKQFAHAGGTALNVAVAGAKRRASGDAFVWDQRRSTIDISPFNAQTLALWGFLTQGPPKNAGKGRVIALA